MTAFGPASGTFPIQEKIRECFDGLRHDLSEFVEIFTFTSCKNYVKMGTSETLCALCFEIYQNTGEFYERSKKRWSKRWNNEGCK